MKIHNPYTRPEAPWLRGNLHAHTTNSDGDHRPEALIKAYADRFYDFLMISDHDYFTDPSELPDEGLVLIPGNEVTANGSHILQVGVQGEIVPPTADRQQVFDAIVEEGSFAIVAHPNWEPTFTHWDQHALESLHGYLGVEIYNGITRRHRGDPQATNRWDRLLGEGRKLWGYAHDDSHEAVDFGIAWNMVQESERNPEAIVAALREGRFYGSTGVTIREIAVEGATIHIQTEDAQCIIAYSDHGHREATVDGKDIHFTVPEHAAIQYVRFECFGWGEQRAWTQPFYIG